MTWSIDDEISRKMESLGYIKCYYCGNYFHISDEIVINGSSFCSEKCIEEFYCEPINKGDSDGR